MNKRIRVPTENMTSIIRSKLCVQKRGWRTGEGSLEEAGTVLDSQERVVMGRETRG